MRRWSARPWLVGVSLALSVWCLGGAVVIQAKAWLAPRLIARAWDASDEGRQRVIPWPGADLAPAAELQVPRLGLTRWVLDGDSGHDLAFGPGLSPAASRPGEPGLVVISGHRDTHFRFLEVLQPGETLLLRHAGIDYRYAVEHSGVVDARDGVLPAAIPPSGLLLVTCYPFDAAVPGGPLRFLVLARALPASSSEVEDRGISSL